MIKRQETHISQISIISLKKAPNGLLREYHYFEVSGQNGAQKCRVSIHKHGFKLAWKKAILSMAKINGTPPMVSAIRKLPRIRLS
jgi:hypothetical protein